MANNYVSLKLSYDTAYRFVEDFSSTDHSSLKYVFIGNSNQYANSDNTIPDISDTPKDEKSIWNTMFAAKRTTGNDVEMVVPKVAWTTDTVYKQFDDTKTLDFLISSNGNSSPMYVYTDEGNVYKCLSNNSSANSTVKPTGDYTTSNGFISTGDGGADSTYIWKFMYNIKDTNKFLTDDLIPVPSSVYAQEYGTSEDNLVPGALASIIVVDKGSGYVDSNIGVTAYTSGTNILTIANTTYAANNMLVQGTGIIPGTHIISIDSINRKITLSAPATSNGNGEISLVTRVYIDGDGNSDTQVKAIIGNTQVEKIVINSVGTGYKTANVFIYGTGSGANARAILSLEYGHGFNPARELGSRSVIISQKFGEIDSTEGGIISTDTSFRQYGLLSRPHKYGENTAIQLANANNVISQTYDLTLLPGSDYQLDEFVFQGAQISSPTFSGIVHAQDSAENTVRLINVKGQITIGGLLKTNTVQRAVTSIDYPYFQPYSGDVLVVQNSPKIERFEGQSENVKLVINF